MYTLTFQSHYQRPSLEEACSVLPVLATVVMQCGKKLVICVAQCVAALVPVHRMLSLLSGVYRFPKAGQCSVNQDEPLSHMVVL